MLARDGQYYYFFREGLGSYFFRIIPKAQAAGGELLQIDAGGRDRTELNGGRGGHAII